MIEMLQYPFLQRALLVGVLVALCAALVGIPLVLKRYAMIGDGLSHVSFGAMCIALALGIAPLAVAIPIVVAAAFLLLRVRERAKLKGDAAIALISSSALALGVTVTSLQNGLNLDVNSYMFGSILAMSEGDVLLSVICSAVILALYALCYPKLFAATFDEDFAEATGTPVRTVNSLLAAISAVVIVVGMRMMGALLISSLLIFPALTAMRVCKSFRGVVLCASVVSVACFCVGIVISFYFDIPTGASVVLTNLAAFLASSAIGKLKH